MENKLKYAAPGIEVLGFAPDSRVLVGSNEGFNNNGEEPWNEII